jgi:endonuclease/exonuclease/phosphatase (EEP) superfamily protein YafD
MSKYYTQSPIIRFFTGMLTAIIVAANIVACGALIAASFAGNYSPTEHHMLGVLPMIIPAAALAVIVLIVIDIIAWRRTAAFAFVCLMLCMPAILDVFPVHIKPRALNGEEQERSWTLLSFNNFQNIDITGEYPDDENPYATYILQTDADVVCLQENEYFGPSQSVKMTQAQIDSLSARYPYIMLGGHALAIFSKYKIEPIDLGYNFRAEGGGDMAAYRLYINDKRVTLFNVHLRSFGLTDNDKELYHELTEFKGKRRYREVRSELVGKVADAAADRALQADSLVRYIKHFGGTNVVVCGDFNDVPGCYTMRQLEEQQLKDVYGSIGFGYLNTYNANRLYFCIDHVMWRGDFAPRSIICDKLPISDHYPLLTTFVFNN